ncbi:hypothetical protein HDU92_007007 [Lobulomyces angularis]|nr:hypothetical protein HDU92_007007 [Lobulomyces angularis]
MRNYPASKPNIVNAPLKDITNKQSSSNAFNPLTTEFRQKFQVDSSFSNKKSEEIETFIAVLGLSAAEKSHLIRHLIGLDECEIGTKVQEYSFMLNNKKITLVDTPGFSYSMEDHSKVLSSLISHFKNNSNKKKLEGIIYAQAIGEREWTSDFAKLSEQFQVLLGPDFYPRINLLSSKGEKTNLNVEQPGNNKGKVNAEDGKQSKQFSAVMKKGAKCWEGSNLNDFKKVIEYITELPSGEEVAIKETNNTDSSLAQQNEMRLALIHKAEVLKIRNQNQQDMKRMELQHKQEVDKLSQIIIDLKLKLGEVQNELDAANAIIQQSNHHTAPQQTQNTLAELSLQEDVADLLQLQLHKNPQNWDYRCKAITIKGKRCRNNIHCPHHKLIA